MHKENVHKRWRRALKGGIGWAALLLGASLHAEPGTVDSSGRSPFLEGPRWLIPYVNARVSLHPTQTLDGVAYPPMSAPASGARLHPAAATTLADATPIYSDRDSDNGGGNPQQTPVFNDASELMVNFYMMGSTAG
ncbi:hypothetical protein [Nitratifractor sp.]